MDDLLAVFFIGSLGNFFIFDLPLLLVDMLSGRGISSCLLFK
jgi:hypothetical protein